MAKGRLNAFETHLQEVADKAKNPKQKEWQEKRNKRIVGIIDDLMKAKLSAKAKKEDAEKAGS